METLISYGGAVKALKTADDGTVTVGGYLVRFGAADDTDLEGDFFDGATNFGPAADGGKLGVFYHHGLDGTLKTRQLGVGTVTRKDGGLWLEAQLRARDEYERGILALIAAGKAGYSSGAPPWLVEREPLTVKGKRVGYLAQWPLGEASITPIPAEHRNTVALKSLSNPLAGGSGDAEQALDTLNDHLGALLLERALDGVTATLPTPHTGQTA